MHFGVIKITEMKVIELLQEIKHLLMRQNVVNKKLLSFEEAVAYLDVSKSFLYKLTSQGKITHFKPNNKLIYFRRDDLDNFLQNNKCVGIENEI
jgi:excisionase family DNA binding protein